MLIVSCTAHEEQSLLSTKTLRQNLRTEHLSNFPSKPRIFTTISWSIFTKTGTYVKTPKSKIEFVGVNVVPAFTYLPPKPPF